MKLDRRHSCTTLLFLLSLINLGYAQIEPNNARLLVDEYEELSKSKNFDAIYLQTSKGIYETEEDVWFKAYVLDAQYLIPSSKSQTLFVQLIEDQTNQPVWEEKYEIENGFVDGHLFLNDTLKAGSYTMVAYSSSSFFKGRNNIYAARKLRVFENIKDKKAKVKQDTTNKDSTVHFNVYPESGNLVSGIPGKVAFKAVDSQGLPITLSGKLFENGSPKLEFKSKHAGMGFFKFTPEADKQYSIRLNPPYDEMTYSLPEILTKGKSLQLIANKKDSLAFRIVGSVSETNEKVYLRLKVRGRVQSIAQGNLVGQLLKINIPLRTIPQGIAEVTLFDENLVPVAERLVYVNKEQKLNISTKLGKSEYKTREKATLNIKVTDENDRPVVAHLGLSIYDRLYQNQQDTKNILSHYYLSTHLKGNIYNPAYYFSAENDVTKRALDLLMLTQGWRRYRWNEENLEKSPNRLQILSDTLTGYVRPQRQNQKIEEEQKFVLAFAADSLKGKDFIVTDPKGKFSVYDKHLKIGEKGFFYLKPMTPEKPKHVIDIKDSQFEDININRKSKTMYYPFSTLQEEPISDGGGTLIESDRVNKLEEVLLTVEKKKVFRDKYIGTLDSLAKLLIPDYVGSCGHLNCAEHNDKTQPPVEGEIYSEWVGNRPHVHKGWYKHNEFERKEYHYPEYSEADLLKKFNLIMLKGYYGKREFYSPVYDKETVADPYPDYRNTLFWKPNIITNENGEASVEFYTSDLNTKFRGMIEGISGGGLLGNQNFKFNVRKR